MINRLGVLLLLTGASVASPTFAGDSATMKCDASHDRIWVYDSLKSFDVSAKLPCGETVEITGRVKGYVRIRAANGTEGYVPDSTFPDLPPFVDPNDQQSTVSIAKRIVPRAVASPAPIAPASASIVSTPAPAPTPAPAVAIAVAANPAPATVSTLRTVAETAPSVAPAAPPAPVASPDVVNTKSTPSHPAARKPNAVPTPAPAAKPEPPAPSVPAPPPHAAGLTSASTKSSSRSPSPAPSSKTANTKSAAAQPQPSGAHPAPTPSVPTPAVSTTKAIETTTNVPPQPVREVASVHTVAATDSDEYPDFQPENASADPACQLFFSAYGLSPAQFKWLAQNRKKQFSSICPAPDVSKVDYVIIFTHDVDFFGSTLPNIVHTDRNGFSDFSPMTMIDTALIPLSEADKSRREYVWVFKMQRGNFDPAKFSPRRRPQFSKSESHAPTRTIEEALRYIESGGTSQ